MCLNKFIYMHKISLVVLSMMAFGTSAQSIENPFTPLTFILGEWTGNGIGLNHEKTILQSGFRLSLNNSFIEVSNEWLLEPTETYPKGEIRVDKGFISFDKSRKVFVFRQFHGEGFVNQYILNNNLSDDSLLVFDSELIENFVPGGKARWTLKKISETELETAFYLSASDEEFVCYGTNFLTKKPTEFTQMTPKVTGIGGVFFFAQNPDSLKAWYAQNLGLAVNDYGSTFEFRNTHPPHTINYLQWSLFKEGNAYFEPSTKEFMINYRVQNIEALVKSFKERGITVLDEIETYDYGKFVHIMDPEGNKLELWEPVDHIFTEMGGETTK